MWQNYNKVGYHWSGSTSRKSAAAACMREASEDAENDNTAAARGASRASTATVCIYPPTGVGDFLFYGAAQTRCSLLYNRVGSVREDGGCRGAGGNLFAAVCEQVLSLLPRSSVFSPAPGLCRRQVTLCKSVFGGMAKTISI